MKRHTQQNYITVPRQPLKPQLVGGITTEELFASEGTTLAGLGQAALTYTLEAIAREHERVLLVSYGAAAKKIVRAVGEAGLEAWLTYTSDCAGADYLALSRHQVCLAQTHSDALYRNEYALLQAAQSCKATAILVALPAADSAQDNAAPSAAAPQDDFARLAQGGCRVFYPLDCAHPTLGWLACEASGARRARDWKACGGCGLFFDAAYLRANHFICPSCGHYHRMSSAERINDVFDAGSFQEFDGALDSADPLAFPGYLDKLESVREKSGLEEAVRCGVATLAGIRFAVCIMESQFFMGSMGSVVGEKITRSVERATREQLPLVIVCASGGARMQEGLASLMQMAKISCALARHGEAGLLYVSVLTDPTTGGVTASFAMQGDIILAEPGALIGFAGQRVIQDTIKQRLPEGFQTAQFALDHGLIDAIVTRADLRQRLAHILALHVAQAGQCALVDGYRLSYASVNENLQGQSATYNTITYGMMPQMKHLFLQASQWLAPTPRKRLFAGGKRKRTTAHPAPLPAPVLAAMVGAQDPAVACAPSAGAPDNPAWESVKLARNTARPTARFYIDHIVDGFIELHGDRAFGDDAAIMAGIGWIAGVPVTVLAQEKGRDVTERVARNFGCPQPEGYRKTLRLAREAEKFGRPLVCLVDTQGAFCGTEAEQRGQGNAIADNLLAFAGLRVPVVSVILGEGGSGGALALALSDKVAMLEHAVYSVLSPEGFASILWKDRSRAPEAAAAMKMSAAQAYASGIVDAVIGEGEAPAHINPEVSAACVRGYLVKSLEELAGQSVEQLLDQRYERFRKF
ncbi:MAG: acetyl-CoA carboxylase, carboxyltransferase subunit beta [Raoultibacter sp.]